MMCDHDKSSDYDLRCQQGQARRDNSCADTVNVRCLHVAVRVHQDCPLVADSAAVIGENDADLSTTRSARSGTNLVVSKPFTAKGVIAHLGRRGLGAIRTVRRVERLPSFVSHLRLRQLQPSPSNRPAGEVVAQVPEHETGLTG